MEELSSEALGIVQPGLDHEDLEADLTKGGSHRHAGDPSPSDHDVDEA